MKTIKFAISGLSLREIVECVVNVKTAWQAIETLAVEPGRFTWFGLAKGAGKTSPVWWKADHLANVATPVLRSEGT